MPPWVTVGPSSTTRTLLPLIPSSVSAVIKMLALKIRAEGFSSFTFAMVFSTSSGLAVFTLLTMAMSAILTLVVPG